VDERVAAGFIVPDYPGELTARALFGPLIAYAPVGLALIDSEFRFVFVNATLAAFNRLSVAEHQGATIADILSKEVWAAMHPLFDQALAGEVLRGQEVPIVSPHDGARRYYLISYYPVWSDRRTVIGVGLVVTDITDSKQHEALVTGQNHLLERITTEAPLEGTLASLVRLVEEQAPGTICAVNLVESEGSRIRLVAGPHLPSRMIALLTDGLPIGPNGVAGAGAAFHRTSTVINDIHTDPLWKASPLTAFRSGLRACWSTPILGDKDEVLGTLDIFHRHPYTPDNRARQIVDAAIHTARIAIDRAREQTRRRILLRDMLVSLTEGRLHLCQSSDDLPAPLTPEPSTFTVLTSESLRTFRAGVSEAAKALEMVPERRFDLESASGEASMNAVVHAGGGEGRVYASAEAGTVQVWVSDRGKGIPEESLHRATLERGYTTAGTLGHGFWMILRTVDRCWLLTGETGTTVVLEQRREEPQPDWLDRYFPAE